MPNWKSYESSVRLLSAIVAAHPGLKLNYDAIALRMDDGTTSCALQHRFRDIKKMATEMNAAIASEYGDGVSGSVKKTPTKRAAKSTPKKAKKSFSGDEDEEMAESPSKGPLNKVKAGRVAKSSPRKGKTTKSMKEESDNDLDHEEAGSFIKNEHGGMVGNGFAVQASHNSLDDSMSGAHDEYYEAAEEYEA